MGRLIFALNVFYFVAQSQPTPSPTSSPYLLGYRAKALNEEPPSYDEYETHYLPAHKPPQSWQTVLESAYSYADTGDYHMSIKTHELIFNNGYLYSRMGPLARYHAHLSLGSVLLRAGIYARAEKTFFEGTSLADEPHEAYKGLALVATLQGRWTEAAAHWKNCLFLAPDESYSILEYLQRLGALLILDGSVNEGRHYLSRAVILWHSIDNPGEANVDAGNNPHMIPPAQLSSMYTWMVDYLLGAIDMDWPPHRNRHKVEYPVRGNIFDVNSKSSNQTRAELRMLTELVEHPSVLNSRSFFDLGVGLWELGAIEAASRHMKRGLAMISNEAYDRSHAMRLRLALDIPWTVGSIVPSTRSFDGGLWTLLEEHVSEYEKHIGINPAVTSLSPVEVAALQIQPMDMIDIAATLGVVAWHGQKRVAPLLRRISRLFRLHCSALTPSAPALPPRDITVVRKRRKKKHSSYANSAAEVKTDVVRVGIVSALFCEHPAGKMLLAAAHTLGKQAGTLGAHIIGNSKSINGGKYNDVEALSRPKLQLTLFAFPTAVDEWSYNITAQAHHYVRLRSGDWVEARRQILEHRLDCVLFADWNDAATLLLGYHRLAPLQVVLVAKGAPSGLPTADYYLVSEYHKFNHHAMYDDEEVGEKEAQKNHYESFSEQVVVFRGLGVPWSTVYAALRIGNPRHVSMKQSLARADQDDSDGTVHTSIPKLPYTFPTVPLRYEYHGHYFFQSENIYVVPAPVQAMRRSFDDVLAKLLVNDPKAVLVFLGDPTEVPTASTQPTFGLISPTQWYQRFLGRVLSHRLLKGNRDIGKRLRLLPRLDHEGRLELLRIADAALDPSPFGLMVPILEAISMGTPVITVGSTVPSPSSNKTDKLTTEHGFGANFLRAIFAADASVQTVGLECCIAETVDDYVDAVLKLGMDPNYKMQVQRAIRRKLSVWAEGSASAQSTSLIDFISSVVQNNRREQRNKRPPVPSNQ